MSRYSLISTFERPDLADISARWRWDAFFRDSGTPLDETLAGARLTAAASQLMPQTLVLLEDGEPVGTASLVAHDLDERPELSPWLAGVVVAPQARGRGHAARLVAGIERTAAEAGIRTLWLYTSRAEAVYARLGWTTAERLRHNNKPVTLMTRVLALQAPQVTRVGACPSE